MKSLILILLFISCTLLSLGQTPGEHNPLEMEKAAVETNSDSLEVRTMVNHQTHKQDADVEDRREAMIRKYGKKKGPMIADGRVWTGLSPEMAMDSWGQPESRKRSEGTWGMNETWYYPEGKYIFFENGRLSKWKE